MPGTEMEIENILLKTIETSPTEEEALLLLKASHTYNRALKIFAVASEVRDREVGRFFKLDGEIAPITPCKIDPFCRYCTFSRQSLATEEVIEGLYLAEQTGITEIRLSGGTDLSSDGSEIVELVNQVKNLTSLHLNVNAGPSYSRENLQKLKELGVGEVGSSLETINPEVFERTKPGDSLERRMETTRIINDVYLNLQSIIMAGLGSTDEDYINHLFFLKKLSNLTHLPISRFNPFKGTPMESHRRASPWEAARVCALARLVLRTPYIRIAAGGGPDDIPLWLLAGGNRITSVFIHQKRCEPDRFSGENPMHIKRDLLKNLEVVDRSALCRSFAEEMGFKVIP
ncbi:MAG: radical SAM protein [Eubacteriales bacterium]